MLRAVGNWVQDLACEWAMQWEDGERDYSV